MKTYTYVRKVCMVAKGCSIEDPDFKKILDEIEQHILDGNATMELLQIYHDMLEDFEGFEHKS